MGKTHESSYKSYPNICSDIEVYRFGATLQVGRHHMASFPSLAGKNHFPLRDQEK